MRVYLRGDAELIASRLASRDGAGVVGVVHAVAGAYAEAAPLASTASLNPSISNKLESLDRCELSSSGREGGSTSPSSKTVERLRTPCASATFRSANMKTSSDRSSRAALRYSRASAGSLRAFSNSAW